MRQCIKLLTRHRVYRVGVRLEQKRPRLRSNNRPYRLIDKGVTESEVGRLFVVRELPEEIATRSICEHKIMMFLASL